ncbi:MAG: hypothetical protein R3E87_24840 [Burkholderiaceae bacterium]
MKMDPQARQGRQASTQGESTPHATTARPPRLAALALAGFFGAASLAALPAPVLAQSDTVSMASEMSALSATVPIAVSASMSALALSGPALLTIVAVQASADGAVWIVEQASTGARAVLRLTGRAAGLSMVGVGTTVQTVTLSAGSLLIASGEVIAFIPNALGHRLMHHERITD